jgi:hypothetical protein
LPCSRTLKLGRMVREKSLPEGGHLQSNFLPCQSRGRRMVFPQSGVVHGSVHAIDDWTINYETHRPEFVVVEACEKPFCLEVRDFNRVS